MKKTIHKRLLTLTSIILISAILAGCNSGSGVSSVVHSSEDSTSASSKVSVASGTASTGKPLKIGISLPNMTNVFFLQVRDGMKAALKDSKDEMVVMDSNGDQNKQMNDVMDMINQGCNVIGLSPINSDGVRATLETCQKAGVPVIAFNVGVAKSAKSLVASTIVSDNEKSGHLCAQALAKALGGKGKVAEITFSTTTTCYQRQKGFEDEIKANYPNIKILINKDVEKATSDYSQPIMVDFINAYPDLDGVFCINDPTARGAIAALKEANKIKSVKVVSVDGSDEGKSFIRAGEMVASAAQEPTTIGAKTIETAYNLLAGKTVEKDVIIPMHIIDSSNVGAATK